MKMFIAFVFAIMQIFPAYAGVKTIVKSDIFEGAQTEPELLGNKGHFERNALSWAAYDDAAGTPVDGTGGSSTTTCARSTSSPIDGDGSLLMTKGAANYQGEGCALTFTIPANMSGDVLVGTFEYAVASGTFATDDVSVWAYNSTGASMGATSPSGLTNHALVRKTFKFQFTPAYSASAQTFRLLLHIATTSASAYTLKFDNFQIHRKGKAAGLDTQVQYNASGLLTGSSNLVWDYTNSRLGIGTTSPVSKLTVYDASNSVGYITGDSTVALYTNRSSTDATSSNYVFRKTRGTDASPTAVATSDTIGQTLFQVYGGSNYRNIAAIVGSVDTYTSDTNISSRLSFWTSPSGSASTVERMRIDQAGQVGIGVTPTTRNNTRLQIIDGIGFPETQVPSTDVNTLDDYEEGTFTPTITADSGTFTTVSATGKYTKIGNTVNVTVSIVITDAGTAAGRIRAGSMPFTSSASFDYCGSGREQAVTGLGLQGYIPASSTTLYIAKYDSTTIIASGRTVAFTITYLL